MESHTGIIEKILDCRNTPRQAAVRLPKINTLRHFRIKTDAMALAVGIDIREEKAASFDSRTVSPKARFSTLQDLDAKRHTEVDMFSGVLVRLGKQFGIPTPYNALALDIIKALEEKNDGRFDYQ